MRSGTSRFCASVTVTNSETTCVPTLNVGCCAASDIDNATASAAAPAIRFQAFMDFSLLQRRVHLPGKCVPRSVSAQGERGLIAGSSASAIRL